jgi:hypothetical protein
LPSLPPLDPEVSLLLRKCRKFAPPPPFSRSSGSVSSSLCKSSAWPSSCRRSRPAARQLLPPLRVRRRGGRRAMGQLLGTCASSMAGPKPAWRGANTQRGGGWCCSRDPCDCWPLHECDPHPLHPPPFPPQQTHACPPTSAALAWQSCCLWAGCYLRRRSPSSSRVRAADSRPRCRCAGAAGMGAPRDDRPTCASQGPCGPPPIMPRTTCRPIRLSVRVAIKSCSRQLRQLPTLLLVNALPPSPQPACRYDRPINSPPHKLQRSFQLTPSRSPPSPCHPADCPCLPPPPVSTSSCSFHRCHCHLEPSVQHILSACTPPQRNPPFHRSTISRTAAFPAAAA